LIFLFKFTFSFSKLNHEIQYQHTTPEESQ